MIPRKDTQRRKRAVRESDLWDAAHAARTSLLPDRDAEEGDCQPVAEAVVDELHRRGFSDAQVILGSYREHPHEWAAVGAYYIDPTYDQFRHFADTPDDEEDYLDNPIVIGKAREMRVRGWR